VKDGLGKHVSRWIALACATAMVGGLTVGCGEAHKARSSARPAVYVRCDNGRIDSQRLVGMDLDDARRLTRRYGCLVRATRVDGRPVPAAQDALTNRIDVAIRSGKVVKIEGIG
jgi:hypothetical protein